MLYGVAWCDVCGGGVVLLRPLHEHGIDHSAPPRRSAGQPPSPTTSLSGGGVAWGGGGGGGGGEGGGSWWELVGVRGGERRVDELINPSSTNLAALAAWYHKHAVVHVNFDLGLMRESVGQSVSGSVSQ